MTTPSQQRMEPGTIALNTEMNGLTAIVNAMELMDPDARGRTLRYLLDRYGVTWPDAPAGLDAYRRPAAPRPSERGGPIEAGR